MRSFLCKVIIAPSLRKPGASPSSITITRTAQIQNGRRSNRTIGCSGLAVAVSQALNSYLQQCLSDTGPATSSKATIAYTQFHEGFPQRRCCPGSLLMLFYHGLRSHNHKSTPPSRPLSQPNPQFCHILSARFRALR
jgi:hypothetical protein